MLVQESMIEKARQACEQDERVVAAVMYGSFALGEGDAFSDIEFVLFFRDDALPDLDQRAWVAQIAPVELYFADDFGHYTAIFDNLIRGEFHFEPASAMDQVDSWLGSVFFPSLTSSLILDRTGELTQRLEPLLVPPGDRGAHRRAHALQMNFTNLMLFGSNVLARGEVARSLEILSLAHRYLLWMARLVEGNTAHWPTPARGLEKEISPAAYARYVACTAPADPPALRAAYQSAWAWGRELMEAQAPTYGMAIPQTLAEKLAARLACS